MGIQELTTKIGLDSAKKAMKGPGDPKKSAAERELERVQLERLSDLSDEENRKKKAILRNRLGLKQLLSGSALGILPSGRPGSPGTGSGATGSGTASSSSGGSGGGGSGSGGGSVRIGSQQVP